jgi:hypothetical protein
MVKNANTFYYDHRGRKLENWEALTVNYVQQSTVLLNHLSFNQIGQLATKYLHSEDYGSTFLQQLDYNYNERGWLYGEHSGAIISGVYTPNNIFNLDLRYNTGFSGTATPQFNGNIAEMSYTRTNPTALTQVFDYTYDTMNRLTNAASSGTGYDNLNEAIGYDDLGNITSLVRGGYKAANLGYYYKDGGNNFTNQLFSVTNSGGAFRTNS